MNRSWLVLTYYSRVDFFVTRYIGTSSSVGDAALILLAESLLKFWGGGNVTHRPPTKDRRMKRQHAARVTVVIIFLSFYLKFQEGKIILLTEKI